MRKKRINLHQPKLIQRIKEKFTDELKDLPKKSTPATAGYTVGQMKEGDQGITQGEQSKFASGVGFCGYLVKHSGPEISNATREHSKQLKGANYGHYKNLLRFLKFIVDMEGSMLRIEPSEILKILWKLKGVVDTGFATDTDTRSSVTRYLIYFCDALIAWKSRLQNNVTLSITEGEYFRLSEISTKILFVRDILVFLGVKIE